MIRGRIGRFLRYFNYPQYVWAQVVASLLNEVKQSGNKIVDAPCGDGVVSYWLIQHGFDPRDFELIDYLQPVIDKAREDLGGYSGISINTSDLHELAVDDADDTWLLVNSFFLLPRIDELVSNLRPRFKYILVVTPHIHRKNYKLYSERPRSEQNVNAMPVDEIVSVFSKHGYHCKVEKGFRAHCIFQI